MNVSVKINSIARTKSVDWSTLKITNILTHQVDTCEFDVLKYGTRTFKPVLGESVEVYDDSGATQVFGGIITKIEEYVDALKILRYRVKAEDYTRLLDRRLVIGTYTNQTVSQIIADIVSTYELDTDEGITTTNVDCDLTIDFIAFNYEPVSKCLQQLANLVNYDWYIDYSKDIHFFNAETISAPFILTDDGQEHVYESLIIRRDNSQVRNSIVVRGGEYLASTVTSEVAADGSQIIFPTGYKFSDIKVTVSAEERTVGTDYLHSEDDYDCLFNFIEKIIRFKELDKPAATKKVRISGRPYIPVIVKYEDENSITTFAAAEGGAGKYEHVIVDKSIKSKAAAQERALAELHTYRATLAEGEFKSYSTGLRAGQFINIQSTIRDLNENFIINKVVSRMFTPKRMEYQVTLVTTKTMGIIDFLQGLVLKDLKKIVIDEDEVVDVVKNITEQVSIAESITAEAASEITEGVSIAENVRHNPFNPPDWCLAYYTVTGDSDTKRHGKLGRSMYLT